MIKNLPQGWRVEKLGKVAEYINGKAFKPSEWAESGLPIIRIQNLNGNENYNFYDGEIEEKYLIHKGDILISWSASLDVYKWDKEEAVLNQHIFNTKINNKLITDDYFYYTIKKALVKILSNLHGSTMQHITKGRFEDIEILLPPLPQQEKIVKVLDKSASLVEQQKQLIEKYDVFLKSKFIEMFGDPITNPMGWKIEKLENLVEKSKHSLKTGPFGSSLKKEFYVKEGYKIYGQEQVIANDFQYGDYYIDEEKYQTLKNYAIKANDILISLVGSFGKIAIVPQKFEAGIINPRLMKISLNSKMYNSIFFKALFYSIGFKAQLESLSHGGTMGILNLTILKELKYISPPIELQNKFASIVEKIEAIKEKETQKLNHLETLHVSLMDKAFKGEIV